MITVMSPQIVGAHIKFTEFDALWLAWISGLGWPEANAQLTQKNHMFSLMWVLNDKSKFEIDSVEFLLSWC